MKITIEDWINCHVWKNTSQNNSTLQQDNQGKGLVYTWTELEQHSLIEAPPVQRLDSLLLKHSLGAGNVVDISGINRIASYPVRDNNRITTCVYPIQSNLSRNFHGHDMWWLVWVTPKKIMTFGVGYNINRALTLVWYNWAFFCRTAYYVVTRLCCVWNIRVVSQALGMVTARKILHVTPLLSGCRLTSVSMIFSLAVESRTDFSPEQLWKKIDVVHFCVDIVYMVSLSVFSILWAYIMHDLYHEMPLIWTNPESTLWWSRRKERNPYHFLLSL